MRFASTLVISALLYMANSAFSAALSDAEVAQEISTLALQNGRIGREAAWLFQQCGSDSNRICNIAESVCRNSTDIRTTNTALSFMWRYGGKPQVAFLETCVTNPVCALYAIRILDRIEGFTSNSVMRIARYHSITNQEVFATDRSLYSDRGAAIVELQTAANRQDVAVALRTFARDYVFSYASNNCYQICTTDRALMSLDSTYKNSRRRLALLRLAQPDVPGPYSPEYVTNAINTLVAYPEANLPE